MEAYDYCLYCEIEHYPFCGYFHYADDNSTIVMDDMDNEIYCNCMEDNPITVESVSAQRSWLETPEGQQWIWECTHS